MLVWKQNKRLKDRQEGKRKLEKDGEKLKRNKKNNKNQKTVPLAQRTQSPPDQKTVSQ